VRVIIRFTVIELLRESTVGTLVHKKLLLLDNGGFCDVTVVVQRNSDGFPSCENRPR
jgi:hypothetical protein